MIKNNKGRNGGHRPTPKTNGSLGYTSTYLLIGLINLAKPSSNRQQQTLRGWACREDGPIRPIRVFGRLAWKTEEIKKLLGVA